MFLSVISADRCAPSERNGFHRSPFRAAAAAILRGRRPAGTLPTGNIRRSRRICVVQKQMLGHVVVANRTCLVRQIDGSGAKAFVEADRRVLASSAGFSAVARGTPMSCARDADAESGVKLAGGLPALLSLCGSPQWVGRVSRAEPTNGGCCGDSGHCPSPQVPASTLLRHCLWRCIARASSRSIRQVPPLSALRDDRALPAAVFGPVDFSHGRQFRINSPRRRRCAGVRR